MSDEVDTHRTTFRHSLTLTAFGVAFCKMQSELGVAIKDSINPHHKYHYNDVASIIQASRPALTNNGFAVMQFPVTKERTVEIETFVLHKSGEWVAETLAIPIAKGDAQGIGSAITYGCKYALLAILGLSRGDDDGQAAVNSVNEQATRNEKDQRAKYVAVLQAGSEKGMLGLLGAWD